MGVPEVHVICLESREEMSTSAEEAQDALVEGTILHNSQGPNRILGDGQRVTSLEALAAASVFNNS